VTAPGLVLEQVTRRFGGVRVLRGVSLQVSPGQIHAIVGPNGAGKSTLLRIAAGLMRPTSGSAFLDGRPIHGAPAARRTLGFLSHHTLLYDDLTAVENLTFVARLYGLETPERTAAEALLRVGLDPAGTVPLRRSSRGTVQRVALARALIHQPRVLLLDEPFTGLDPAAQVRVRDLLHAEAARGTAILLVTHDLPGLAALVTGAHALMGGAWALETGPELSIEDFSLRYREALGV
jgi:heme exporter protein A